MRETFSVARGSAVTAVLQKSKKVALPLQDTCRLNASVAKITTLWSRTASLLYREEKRRKIWSIEGTTYRAKGFLLSQSSSKTKSWQGMMKTLHITILERRGQECMSVRRKPRWREAHQPVSSRPLLSGKLKKRVNFLFLPHC